MCDAPLQLGVVALLAGTAGGGFALATGTGLAGMLLVAVGLALAGEAVTELTDWPTVDDLLAGAARPETAADRH